MFQKDKSIAPRTIEEIAKGEPTQRWLVSCAIDVLIEEKPELIRKILSDDDLVFLWAKPLLSAQYPPEQLANKTQLLRDSKQLNKKIDI